MLNEPTHEKMVAMRCYGMAAAFQEFLEKPDNEDLTVQDLVGLLVDREWSRRQERSLQNRLRTAKLREKACPEDINFRHPRGLDRSVIQKLLTSRWVVNHETVILTGPTGAGKTWIGCALCTQAWGTCSSSASMANCFRCPSRPVSLSVQSLDLE